MAKSDFCILLTGQLRGGINNVINIAGVGKQFGAVTVVSTWDHTGTKVEGALGYWQFVRLFGYDVASCIPVSLCSQKFYDAVPGLKAALVRVARRKITADEILDRDSGIIVDIESESMDLRENMPGEENTLALYYKIWRANRIKRRLERENSSKFKGVLRLRADLQLHDNFGHFVQNATNKNVFYLDAIWRDASKITGVGDGACYTSSHEMDYYSSMFHNVISRYPGDWAGTHKELLTHLTEVSASIESFPCVSGQAEAVGWFRLLEFLKRTQVDKISPDADALTMALELIHADCLPPGIFDSRVMHLPQAIDFGGVAFAFSVFASKKRLLNLAVLMAGLAATQIEVKELGNESYKYLHERLKEACSELSNKTTLEVQAILIEAGEKSDLTLVKVILERYVALFGSSEMLLKAILERTAAIQ